MPASIIKRKSVKKFFRAKIIFALLLLCCQFFSFDYNAVYSEDLQSYAAADRLQDYNALLDELASYPPKNENTLNLIVNKILAFKGYPENILNVSMAADSYAAKSIDSFMLANFNFVTGRLNVSRKLFYEYDIKALIAVLAHELDHFDKIACVCRSMGIDKFSRLFEENGVSELNTSFWINASNYASLNNFDADLYSGALRRFLTQKDLEFTSSYSDFYRIAENMRNPLEINAYKESDYVYNHFHIKVIENDMKRLSKIFNQVDWSLYNLSGSNPVLSNERIALFDYFYAKTIIQLMPEFYSEFQYCDMYNDGNLTAFWLKFERRFYDFYKGRASDETKAEIIHLLTAVNENIKRGLTQNEAEKALIYKMNTLKSNLVYTGAALNLRQTALDYLKYIKQNNINNPKQELNAILILICIDNGLYTNTSNTVNSLADLYMPEEIIKIYNLTSDERKSELIYNNPSFKERTASIQGDNRIKIIELVKQSRLKAEAPQ